MLKRLNRICLFVHFQSVVFVSCVLRIRPSPESRATENRRRSAAGPRSTEKTPKVVGVLVASFVAETTDCVDVYVSTETRSMGSVRGECMVLSRGHTCDKTATSTIRYDTKCYFNVRSKADMSQLNLPQGNDM